MKSWYIDSLPGDGRGGIFFNREPDSDELCGLELVDYDGYDNSDDYDDFGHEFYAVTVKGTEDQVKDFIETNFYGKGEYSEEV